MNGNIVPCHLHGACHQPIHGWLENRTCQCQKRIFDVTECKGLLWTLLVFDEAPSVKQMLASKDTFCQRHPCGTAPGCEGK